MFFSPTDTNIIPISINLERRSRFNATKACNNKLIGARYYLGLEQEHGPLNQQIILSVNHLEIMLAMEHTAATTIRSIVKNTSFLTSLTYVMLSFQ